MTEYEDSKGYKSFGRTCDEIYENTDFECFSSIEDLEEYVYSMNDYLQIIDDDGELYVETRLQNNAFRYLMNEDKMYVIDQNVYKAVDSYIITTDVENIENLKAINENNYMQHIKDKRFMFSPIVTTNITNISDKDSGHNCGTSKTVRKDNGRDRTKLDLTLTMTLNGNYTTNIYGKALVRPYKKTLGVWYWCSRTISCNIKTATGIYLPEDENWIRVTDYYSKTLKGSKIERIFINRTYSGHFYSSYAHFDGYDAWGSTPSTGKAEAKCNTSLF